MKRLSRLILLGACSTLLSEIAAPNQCHAENSCHIYVDKNGRMRRSDTGEEARYYGTNYTLPFAHGYRAAEALGIDHKQAIDRDVYHMSRMGANAFRLHLWDAELADSIGNLVDNHHLDLLDYLIASLEKRNITIILTAQTNFGNGYPEKNIDTGAFTYDFGKCEIHENPEAIKAQKRYIGQLVKHVNPYTGTSYGNDGAIIAMEINNEPCHQSNPQQVKDYINTMAKTMRKNGWRKPILYNVSHNMPVAEGYFSADIDGATYQWYPVGLVAGHERKGNFLPYVDSYRLPYTGMKGEKNKAKVIYEFDPADMLDSYMFPAVARTFAREGFQWATQFAYDPIDIARFNTEYQTHYLNLAYTPQKALGMKIAAKVMETTPVDADYGKYPADTVFGPVTVSYRRNLAVLNTPREYFHTNNTDLPPVDRDSLVAIAGYGSSPIVAYQGRGAYLIDRVKPDIWRLEVMPDVLYSADPFGKPSLNREAAHAISASHPITLDIPSLGDSFFYRGINEGNNLSGKASGNRFTVSPGVYLLGNDSAAVASIDRHNRMGNIRLDEFVSPPSGAVPLHVNHSPSPYAYAGNDIVIRAEAFGTECPDSLVIYPAEASFWRDDNRLYTMHRVAPYVYEAVIPASDIKGRKSFEYRIAVSDSRGSKTYPAGIPGLPLDWDAPETELYATRIISDKDPVILLSAKDTDLDVATIPDQWGRSRVSRHLNAPAGYDVVRISASPGEEAVRTIVSRYVKDVTTSIRDNSRELSIAVRTGEVNNLDSLTVAAVNSDGVTFAHTIAIDPDSIMTIRLSDLTLSPTLLCPAPYPVFLDREMMPENYSRPLIPQEIEKIEIIMPENRDNAESYVEIAGVWIEN
ncbi:MAG: cellulase family glycosylhydrolase [Muribaculaceae bacterium]|nr:cellulase family glycosylhydrolase [Muribaculaceae bacterium]